MIKPRNLSPTEALAGLQRLIDEMLEARAGYERCWTGSDMERFLSARDALVDAAVRALPIVARYYTQALARIALVANGECPPLPAITEAERAVRRLRRAYDRKTKENT